MNNNFRYYLRLIIAIFFVSYIIYIRLLVFRLPKNLIFIENNVINLNIILMTFSGIVLALFMLYSMVKNIYKNSYSSNRIQKIFQDSLLYIENALQELHIYIVNKIPGNYEKMSFIANKFYNAFENKSEIYLLVIIFIIRFIILFAFLIDVFIYLKFFYMYKALYLLCLIILINITIYMLKDFSFNLEEIKSALIIEDLGFDEETQLPVTNYNLKEEYKHFDLEYHVTQYILCCKIKGYFQNYDRYKSFFTPYVNIMIYTLYLIGWLYILYYNCAIL